MRDRLFFFVQALLKYNAFNFGIWLRSICYRPFFRSFGCGVKIRDGVTFKYPSEIDLGDHVKIEQHCMLVGKGGLRVGSHCLLGAGTKIITSEHVVDRLGVPMAEQGLRFRPVYLDSDVWCGFDVKVLAGSVVGKGSILGANTFVNGIEVAPYSVMVGSPARLLKMRTRG